MSPSASFGRSVRYFGSPTGASTEIESIPPAMNTDTSTRSPGAAAATPSWSAAMSSFDAP